MNELINEASQEIVDYVTAFFEAFADVPADAPDYEVKQLIDEYNKPRN